MISEKPGAPATCCIIQGLNVSPVVSTGRFHPEGDCLLADGTSNSKALRVVSTSSHVGSVTTPSAFTDTPDAATVGQLTRVAVTSSSRQEKMTDDRAMLWPSRIAVTTGGTIGSLTIDGRAAQWQSVGAGVATTAVTLNSAAGGLLPLTVLSSPGWHRLDATGIVQPAAGGSERPAGRPLLPVRRDMDVTRSYTVADEPSACSAVTIAGGQQLVRSDSASRASPLGLDSCQSAATMGICRTFTIGRMGSLPWVVPGSPPRCVLPQSTALSPLGGSTLALAAACPSEVSADHARDLDGRQQQLRNANDDRSGALARRLSSSAGSGGSVSPTAAVPRRTGYAPLARLQPNVRFPVGARIVHPLQDHDYCYDVYCKLVVSSAKSLATPVRVRPRKHPRKGAAFGGVGRPCLSSTAAPRGSGSAAVDKQLGLLDKCVPRLKRKYERRKSAVVSTASTAACLQAVSAGNEDQTCEQLKQPVGVSSPDRDLMSQYKIPSSRSSQLRKPSLRDEYVYFGGTKLKSRTRNLDRKENEEPPLQPFYSSHAFYWSGLPASTSAPSPVPPPTVCRSENDAVGDDGTSADSVATSAKDSTLFPPDATGFASRSETLDIAAGQLDLTPKECVGTLSNAVETLDIGAVLPTLGISEYDGQFIDADITVDDDVDLSASAAGNAPEPALQMVAASGTGAVAAAASIGDLLSSMTEAEIKQVVQALGANLESCCNNEITVPFGLPPDGNDLGPGILPELNLSSAAAELPCPCDDSFADPASAGPAAEAILRVGPTDFSTSAGPTVGIELQQPPREELLRPLASADSAPSAENGSVANSTHTPQVVPLQMFWNTFPALQIGGKRYVRLVDIHRQALPSKDTGLLKRRAAALGFAVDNFSEMQRNLLVRYANASPSRSTLVVDDRAAEAVIASYLEPQGLRAMSAASGASKRTSVDTDAPQLQAGDRPREATASAAATLIPPDGAPTGSIVDVQALPPAVAPPDSGRRPCIVAVMPKRGRPPIRRTEQQQRQQATVGAAPLPPTAVAAQRPVRREPSPTRTKSSRTMANSRRRISAAAGASRRRASALLLRKKRCPSFDGAECGASIGQLPADDACAPDTCPPARSQRLRQVKTCYRRFLNLRHSGDGVDAAGDELSDRGYQSGDSSPIFVPSSAPTPCSTAAEDQPPLAEPSASRSGAVGDRSATTGDRCPTAARRLSTDVDTMGKGNVPSEHRYVDLLCTCHLSASGFVHKGRLDVQLCRAGDPRCIQCALCKLHMTVSIFALHRHTPLRDGIDGTSDSSVSQSAPCRLEGMRLWPASSDAAVAWRELVQHGPSAASENAADASSATPGASRRSSRVHKDKQLHPIEAYEYEWAKRRRTSSSSDNGAVSVAAGTHVTGVAALDKCAVDAGSLQRIKQAQSESTLKLSSRRPRNRRQ